MLKKFLSILLNDFHWKLLSLCMAFVLWFFGANMNNPYINDQFTTLLQLHDYDVMGRDNIVLLNEDEVREKMVQIVVRGRRHDLDELRNPDVLVSSVIPSISFLAIDNAHVHAANSPVSVPLNISVNLYPGLEHLSIVPGYVSVLVDAVSSVRLPVVVNDMGDIAPGFELRGITLTNNQVTLTGARSVIETVQYVRVDVDVLGVHAVTELNVPLMVFNYDGYEITDYVHLSVTETTANVAVWPVAPVNILVETVGALAPGLAVLDVEFHPSLAELTALPARLEELEYIVAQVNLDGMDSTFTYTIEIADWLPDGVFLSNNAVENVAVHVIVEPIERRLVSVPREQVRQVGFEAIYQVIDDATHIRVDVSGPRSKISALETRQIGLELDLSGLEIGIHYRALNVDLPEGIILAGARPVLRVQIHEPAPLVVYEYEDYYYEEYEYDDE